MSAPNRLSPSNLRKLQEIAAWDFISSENPSFTLAVVCLSFPHPSISTQAKLQQLNPPMIYGPVAHHLSSLSSLNTSNQRFRDLISGSCRDACPPTGLPLWVDARDLALAHVLCVEVSGAGGKRFFVTAGPYSNKEIVGYISEYFPEYRDKLPQSEEALKPGANGDICGFDNKRSIEVLGMKYRGFGECVKDTVESLKGIPA